MVPVGLNAKSRTAAAAATRWARSWSSSVPTSARRRPAQAIHDTMRDGKHALAHDDPLQIQAMSAVGQVPAILLTLLGMTNLMKPAYNLVISNVPGPRTTQYFNGAELLGTYPLSVPIDGNALNITCNLRRPDGLRPHRLPRTVPHPPADPRRTSTTRSRHPRRWLRAGVRRPVDAGDAFVT